jgi:hypothetical protein
VVPANLSEVWQRPNMVQVAAQRELLQSVTNLARKLTKIASEKEQIGQDKNIYLNIRTSA